MHALDGYHTNDCQWDPVASHSRSSEELLLDLKYFYVVAGTACKDQA